MSYVFPPELERLVREELATGVYRSEDDLLIEAVRALRERDDTMAAVGEGIADFELGRTQSLDAVDAELRTKYGIGRDA